MSPLRMAQGRLRISFFLVLVIFLSFFVRLVFVQAVNAEDRARQAARELNQTVDLPAPRGEITDRNGNVLARSIDALDLVVDQNLIGDPKVTAKLVAPIINASTSAIQNRLTGTRKFVYVAKDITPAQWLKIKEVIALNNSGKPMSERIGGFFTERGFKRDYPGKTLSANTLGFVNSEGVGGGGIEASMNSLLSGTDGVLSYSSGKGPSIPSARQSLIPAKAGTNIRLTIDRDLQWITENAIASVAKKTRAQSITAVLMDPTTGEILALANWPSYNPNSRKSLTGEQLRNRVLTDTFEPGSTIKPFPVALVMEQGKVQPDTNMTIGQKLLIGPKPITDTHPHGMLTVSQVIQKSSNIGTAKLALQLEPREMWDLFAAVGFGQAPNIGFPGAVAGRLHPHQKWGQSDQARMSFGYGISTSLFQLARAYTIFARDGELVPTTILRNPEYKPGTRVMSAKTAIEMRNMLETVTEQGGTAIRARADGFRVGGKTGTAHKVESKGYVANKYRAFFVGLAPISAPRIVVAVMVDEPSAGGHYGGEVAAPVFSTIVSETLRSLNISPDITDRTLVQNFEPIPTGVQAQKVVLKQ